jgi:hypothetical protein
MVMPVSTTVFSVFGHFQNLNLLALIHDLRAGRTVRQSWLSGSLLCPIAHGLPQGAHVEELRVLGQAADLGAGCHLAARHLDADPDAVLRFVRAWDEGALSSSWLLQQLEELWEERLLDAVTVQELLQGLGSAGTAQAEESEPGSIPEWRHSGGTMRPATDRRAR